MRRSSDADQSRVAGRLDQQVHRVQVAVEVAQTNLGVNDDLVGRRVDWPLLHDNELAHVAGSAAENIVFDHGEIPDPGVRGDEGS